MRGSLAGLSRRSSMTELTINNPYEATFRFMQDCGEAPRLPDAEEVEDLGCMYDDFLELSTRYDDLKNEMSEVMT